jgi:hypothetical protein
MFALRPSYETSEKLELKTPAHQTAKKIGRPRLNLAGRVFFWQAADRAVGAANFLLLVRDFFLSGREFLRTRPRFFYDDFRTRPRFFF